MTSGKGWQNPTFGGRGQTDQSSQVYETERVLLRRYSRVVTNRSVNTKKPANTGFTGFLVYSFGLVTFRTVIVTKICKLCV